MLLCTVKGNQAQNETFDSGFELCHTSHMENITFNPESPVVENLPYRVVLITGRDVSGRPKTRAFTKRTFGTEAEALAFRNHVVSVASNRTTATDYLLVHNPACHAFRPLVNGGDYRSENCAYCNLSEAAHEVKR